MVSVKPALPVVAEIGSTEVTRGSGGPIIKPALLETIPPSSTVTVPAPGEARRAFGTDAVSCIELTKVVGNANPFH
jgi:hypothetical protein